MCFSGTRKRSPLTTGWTLQLVEHTHPFSSEKSELHQVKWPRKPMIHAQQQLFHQPPASTEVWGQSHGYPCCKWPSCGLPRRRVSSWRWLEDRPGAGRQGVRSMPSPPFFQCGKQWRGPFPKINGWKPPGNGDHPEENHVPTHVFPSFQIFAGRIPGVPTGSNLPSKKCSLHG